MRNPSVKSAARLRRINWLQRTNGFKCKCKNRYHKLTCAMSSESNKKSPDPKDANKNLNDECNGDTFNNKGNVSKAPRRNENTDVIN